MSRVIRAIRRASLLAAGALALAGCGEGEVTTLVLPISPDNTTEFEVAQQAMITVGCGGFCHGMVVGNFQVSGEPGNRQAEYQLTTPLIDQDAPDDSKLLRVALAGDPQAAGHAICFDSTDDCAWRIITAWIVDPTDPEAKASAIAETCTPTPDRCP